jgi:hypothetical protein
MALSLELLDRHLGALGEEEYVPILVSHDFQWRFKRLLEEMAGSQNEENVDGRMVIAIAILFQPGRAMRTSSCKLQREKLRGKRDIGKLFLPGAPLSGTEAGTTTTAEPCMRLAQCVSGTSGQGIAFVAVDSLSKHMHPTWKGKR